MLGETLAKLNINGLEVIGSVDTCGAGIQLNGTEEMVVTSLDTHNLTSTVEANGASIINMTKANIVGDPRCDCSALQISTGQAFDLADSVVVGCRVGLQISGLGSSSTHATIINTTLRNADNSISAAAGTVLQMTGGELSNDTHAAAAFFGGSGSFINVKMDNNAIAVGVLGGPTVGVATVLMRGCMVTSNNLGVFLFDMSAGDLGTEADPGNNIFQNNQTVGVSVQGSMGPQQVTAVGNIWNPDIQGANSAGLYSSVSTVSGPIVSVAGNNYDIASGLSLRR